MPPKFVTIGKIGAPHGIKGLLKIHPFTEYIQSLSDYLPWYCEKEGIWQIVSVDEVIVRGEQILAKFTDLDTPEAARLLTGTLLAIPRDRLPTLKDNEYYWSDLVGLTVINVNGEIYGKVIYLIETGSNDVLVVKGGKEQAIPYSLDDVILKVDLEKQEILVNWEPI